MATGAEVLNMLLPNGGWVISGDDYDGITFIEATPITEAEFKAGFSKVTAFKEKQSNEKTAAKAALLERLGITADEAALLLS
jgi:hypothetical protein